MPTNPERYGAVFDADPEPLRPARRGPAEPPRQQPRRTERSSKLGRDFIDTEHLKADSVTATKVTVDTLSALTADMGTLTAGLIRDQGDQVRFDLSVPIFKVLDANTQERVRIGDVDGMGTWGIQVLDASGSLIVDTTALGASTVDTPQLVDFAVKADQINPATVDASKLAEGTQGAARARKAQEEIISRIRALFAGGKVGVDVFDETGDVKLVDTALARIADKAVETPSIVDGAITTPKVTDAGVTAAKLTEQAQSFNTDITFSASDADTVAWTAGTIELADGSTFSINSGNTGNMAGETWIYLGTSVSTTDLQTTTTFGNATGENKLILCYAAPASDSSQDALFVPAVGVLGVNEDVLSANLVASNILKANSITAQEIDAGTITATQIATGTLTASEIAAGAIETAELAADAVTAAKVAAGAIVTEALAADAVVASKIAAGEVKAEQIAAGAVVADKIAGGAVTAGKVSTGTLVASRSKLTQEQLASRIRAAFDGKIGADIYDETGASKLVDSAAAQIGDAAVVTTSLAAGAVTAGKISVSQLSAITADVGVLTAGRLEDSGGSYGVLLSGSVPAGWSRWLNLVDTNKAFLKHENLSLKWDGSAVFSGEVSATSFTANQADFSGHIVVQKSSNFTEDKEWRQFGDRVEVHNFALATVQMEFNMLDGGNVTLRANQGQLLLDAADEIDVGGASGFVIPTGVDKYAT